MNLRHERDDDLEKYHNGKLLSLIMKMNLAIALNLRSALFVIKIVTHKFLLKISWFLLMMKTSKFITFV